MQYATGFSERGDRYRRIRPRWDTDVVTANQSASNISVLLGKGHGAFAAAINAAMGATTWGVAIGDFKNNGRTDLAVANFNSNNVSVMLDRCVRPRRRARP